MRIKILLAIASLTTAGSIYLFLTMSSNHHVHEKINMALPTTAVDPGREGGAVDDGGTNYGQLTSFNGFSRLSEFRKEAFVNMIPTESFLQEFTMSHLQRIYISYLNNVDILCRRKLRMGRIGDGGWEVCDDEAWRPGNNCIVYSFGIGRDFSFDDAVASTYGCHVFAFDPSMKTASHNRSKLVHFYKWGLSGTDGILHKTWEVFELSTLRRRLGHASRVIDVVKMDIETSEWDAIASMISSGQLKDIRQLYVEFHGIPKKKTDLFRNLKIFRELEQAGFRRFHSHKNPLCREHWEGYPGTFSFCVELHLVNTKLWSKQ